MPIAPIPTLSQPAASTRPDIDRAAPPATSPANIAPASSTAPLLNPDPVINSSLGIVVLQYFSQAGNVTQTFPSRQQLDTYQIYGLKGLPSQTE